MVKWKGQLNLRPGRGRPGRRRARFLALAASVLAAVALAAGCSTSTSTASSGASSSASASITGTPSPGTDIGLTSTTIRIGMIADVDTQVTPGLFQRNVDAVEAWAKMVNASGGLAGRKVVVDFCDSKLDPNATTACVIKACENDFALVGTAANALSDYSDLDDCKNAAGQPIGIPNLAAFGFPPYSCDKVTYIVAGMGPYCATAKDDPQTYSVNIGDFRYYESHFSDLHGVWVYDDDVPTVRITSIPEFQAGVNIGIKEDGEGFYPASGEATQSDMTPIVQVMKADNSTFGYGGATPQNTIQIRKEALLQGVNSVKVWACNSGCYDQSFLQEGGSAVNGEYALLNYLPFYTDYTSNPTLKALVSAVGGISNINGNALESYIDALLFQDAVNKAVANGGTLDRQTLFDALNKETSFDADGIIGPTDVAAHALSACIVIAQVQNGQWKRVYPATPDTFDCSPDNLVTIKMNLNQ